MKQHQKTRSVLSVVAPIIIIVGISVFGGMSGVMNGLVSITEVRAETPPCNPTNTLCNPLGETDEPHELWGKVIRFFLSILGVVSLATFVLAGATFVASGGNPERVKKARDMMLYAVIGLGVALGAYVILSFVINQLTGQVTGA